MMRSRAELLLILVLSSCGGKDSDSASTSVTAEEPYSVDCSEVYTWETTGAPFVYTWCSSCHSSNIPAPGKNDTGFDERAGAPGTLNFDSKESVCSQISLIESAVFGDRMPPGGGPSEADLAALQAWIDCGPADCTD